MVVKGQILAFTLEALDILLSRLPCEIDGW